MPGSREPRASRGLADIMDGPVEAVEAAGAAVAVAAVAGDIIESYHQRRPPGFVATRIPHTTHTPPHLMSHSETPSRLLHFILIASFQMELMT